MRSLLFILPLVCFAQTKPPAGSTPSYKDLRFAPLRQIVIPEIATSTLPNGMQILLLENHELPLVRGTAIVRTGNLFDTKDKIGLATVTGEVMRLGGTQSKTGDQIDEQLENIAASVETSIGESSGTVSFSTLKENTDEVLGVFKEILTTPEFREEKIDLAKTQMRSVISRRNDEPGGIAAREFASLVYGRDNSYGWDMNYEHVARIQRADVIAFYKRYYFPANIILAVQGDFSAPEMKAKLEKLFADWTYTQEKVPPFPTVKKQPNAGVYVAAKNDVTQTTFLAGQLSGTFNEKDYPALEVMADILGGGFRSRLFQLVRTKLGFAYSVAADWGGGYDHPGMFEISGSTKSFNTTEALKVIMQEVERIRTAPVTADELEAAKQTVLNGFVFHFDTRAKTLTRLLTYKYYGYPTDFLTQYQKAIASVTAADILRVAKERLDPKSFTIVAVGKPKDFNEPISALGLPVNQLDISIPELKPEVAAVDPASLEKGAQLLRKVQAAAGGAGKLAAVKDSTMRLQLQVDPAAGGLKAEQLNQWIAPTQFRQEAQYPFGKIISYFDGAAGWLSTPQGVNAMPDGQRKQMQGELLRMWWPLLLSDRAPGRKVNLMSEGVLEISDPNGESVRMTVDSKTGLPSKIEYQAMQPQGPPVSISLNFSEFQALDGIQIPKKYTLTQNGKKFADITISEVKLNGGLNADVLGKRP